MQLERNLTWYALTSTVLFPSSLERNFITARPQVSDSESEKHQKPALARCAIEDVNKTSCKLVYLIVASQMMSPVIDRHNEQLHFCKQDNDDDERRGAIEASSDA